VNPALLRWPDGQWRADFACADRGAQACNAGGGRLFDRRAGHRTPDHPQWRAAEACLL